MKMTLYKKASGKGQWSSCEWPTELVARLGYFFLNKIHTKHSDSGQRPFRFEDKYLPWTTIWDFGHKRIFWDSPQIQKSKQKSAFCFQGYLLFRQPELQYKVYSPMKFLVTWILFLNLNACKSPVLQPDFITESNNKELEILTPDIYHLDCPKQNGCLNSIIFLGR